MRKKRPGLIDPGHTIINQSRFWFYSLPIFEKSPVICHFYVMHSIITADNIWKVFGRYSILEDLSLKVEKGSVYGLVGLNGAGKTTLLRLLAGNLKATRGELAVMGFRPWDHREEFYRNLGIVLENDGFWGNLTIRENLSIYASAKQISPEKTEEYLREYWKDTEIYSCTKKVKYLSRGQKMQCALCRAFLGWPSVFLLDEPAVALDITAFDHFCNMINIARDRGAALIISSHQLDLIDKLCGRVGILRDKHLSELDRNKSPLWSVTADSSEQWKEIIEKSGGRNVIYDGQWRFEIENPEISIPELVTALVHAGCRIREVRSLDKENILSDTIRDIYGSRAGGAA